MSARRFAGVFRLGMLLIASGAVAESPDERRALEQVQERIEAARKSREALKDRWDALDQEVAGIDREAARIAKAITALEREARERQERVKQLERRQAELAAASRNQQRALAGEARAAYAAGHEDWLKLLLNQEDPSRLTRVLAYHSYLNRARSSLLQGAVQESQAARERETELLAESERLKIARERLSREQSSMAVTRSERNRLLATLGRELKDKDAELDRLRDDERRLQDLLTSIESAGPNRLPADASPNPSPSASNPTCPVAGRLAGQFGSARGGGRWDGILIEAAEGTPVRTVAEGRVAFSDWLRGYGWLAIVDHGGGVMSLYAFNQTLYKEVGDRVAAGDVIAAVGTSGGRPAPGLYFGIRRQGRAVDPSPWCRRSH